MDALNFVYWLQGHLEIGNPEGLSKEQVEIINEHIALVLEKKTTTPSYYYNGEKAYENIFSNTVFNHQGSC